MVRIFRSFVPAGMLVVAMSCASSAGSGSVGAPPPPAASPGPAAVTAQAADGSSADRAVMVPRETESEGVAWEYAWIRQHYGPYQRKEQRLITDPAGRPLDRITVRLSDGTERTFYFDISRYFGRL